MFNSAIQLTFPCPACGGFLTLRTFKAAGPCPACGTHLTVNLSVQAETPTVIQPAVAAPAPPAGKKFDERRFRPVTQSQPQV